MSSTGAEIHDILFDLGNVLVSVNWNAALGRLRPHLASKIARLIDEDRWAFRQLFRDPYTLLESGKIDFDEFHKEMSSVLGIDLSRAEFEFIWCDIFSLDEAMVSLGETLAQNYGTWLVSNTNKEHYQWIIEKFPRVVFFRAAALSFEIGAIKPDPEYYTKMIEKFGINPAHAVFIDDLPENVEGALKQGLHGILFRGYDKLIPELRRLGISNSA